ncbi:MAG: MFS transporter [Cellulosilyticaceae bacterium]
MQPQQIVKRFSMLYIINVIGGAFFNNVYILFMSTTKGFSDQQISWIMGIIPIITFPAMFWWGKFLDKNKKLMGSAWIITLFNGVAIALLYWTKQYYLFFAIALIRTFVLQPMGSICEEYMITTTQKAHIPYGKVRRFGTLGVGIAGLVAPVIIGFLGIGGMILIGGIIVFLSAFLFKTQPEVNMEHKEEAKEDAKVGSTMELLKNKEFLKVLAIVTLSYGALNSAAIYGNQMILLKMACPEMIIVSLPVLLMIIEIGVLGISHKIKVEELPYRAMFIGMVIMCIRWIILALSSNYMWVIFSALLNGVIVGITLPAQNYLIAQVVPERQRSTAYLLSVVIQMSVIPGIINLIIGALLPTVGISIFGISYLLVTIMAMLCLQFKIKNQKISEELSQ